MSRRISLLLATVAAIAVAGLVSGAARAWSPADTADIHPGVQTVTGGGQCTSNFVFQDVGGVYLGQAAHCSGTGGATETNGCDSASLPLGAAVEIEGASRPGVMVYNSRLAMRAAGESGPNACEHNDFALVRVDPADVAEVNPSVPGFGGPTGLAASPGGAGSAVHSYGNSSLRGGVSVLKPKQATVVQAARTGSAASRESWPTRSRTGSEVSASFRGRSPSTPIWRARSSLPAERGGSQRSSSASRSSRSSGAVNIATPVPSRWRGHCSRGRSQ